ncbi:ATP-dependent helicase [Arhodomonas aquaeolei]|uniref:ATP-dependent helicase n=1 Tax=Arhodomonas aquaeolei TaxID=2369 RepID=UPI0003A33F54|nr:ATP-dependent helicase [Arhodomonas aquaeolei]
MLDDDQSRVVDHEDGPAAVLAGAGSGKTRCTTERAVRRLRESGVDGEAMVLLTFTNKAAGEMRERIRERLPEGLALPWIGTFHSYGNALLRRWGHHIRVPGNATLMDADDARRMLDALLAGPFSERQRRQEALQAVEAINARGLDVTEEADLEGIVTACGEYGFGPVASARMLERLRRFEREKRDAAVIDFADLIALPARLLRRHPEVRELVAGTLRDVTVDEAQDTDAAQFRLLELLAPPSRTVLLVGDDDQAIYEWRHARPENLRTFIEAWSASVYRLERNYRSTPAIVGGGASLVRHNTARLDKSPYAVRAAPEGDGVHLVHYDAAEAMAEGVAERLERAIRGGAAADHLAVLYRKNRMARFLETALLRRAVPYRVKAGTDLLGYADVRMMLAAGRLAANRRDIRALSRLAELVPGLGVRGVSRLLSGGGDPFAAAGALSPRASEGLDALRRALDDLHARGPGGLFEWCRQTPMINDWLLRRARRGGRGEGGEGDPERALRPILGRLRAIQGAVRRRLDALPAGADRAAQWASALEVVSAGTDEAEEGGRVTLCTVHAAKGLEWPEVHLFGFSEGLMPMEREGVVENLPEERRLGYVAITRAQDRLILHHADRVDMGGGEGPRRLAVSRFLEEVRAGQPVTLVDRRRGAAGGGEADAGQARDWLAEMRRALG